MIGREKRMLLRHYLEEGLSKSEISRRLDVSRDTIHREWSGAHFGQRAPAQKR